VKIYEYHIKEDMESVFIDIQEKVLKIYKEYISCEVMYLKSLEDETKWMEVGMYNCEEDYENGMKKMNEKTAIQQLFQQFELCLVREKQAIKESDFRMMFKG